MAMKTDGLWLAKHEKLTSIVRVIVRAATVTFVGRFRDAHESDRLADPYLAAFVAVERPP